MPARATGRGRARTAAAEAEPAASEDEEEGSEQQQGSLLGSLLHSAKKAVSRGRRGEAEDGEQGESLDGGSLPADRSACLHCLFRPL